MNVVTQKVDRPDSGTAGTAFRRLLRWLDEGADSQGERYLEVRRRLVAYFDRRNRPAPDMLADETLDRVSRTLEESGRTKVSPPARYCYVVARFVLLEDIRRGDRSVPFDETRPVIQHDRSASAAAGEERARQSLDCLGRCLGNLKPEDRELIVEYYRDAKRQRIDRRRELAAGLGITMNALGIRTWRLRASLERCVAVCRKRSCQDRGRDRDAARARRLLRRAVRSHRTEPAAVRPAEGRPAHRRRMAAQGVRCRCPRVPVRRRLRPASFSWRRLRQPGSG